MPKKEIHEPAWLFRRNEMDLLQFDYHTLCTDAKGRRRRLTEVEEEVFEEQDATDEEASSVCPFHDHHHEDDDVEDEQDEEESLSELLASPLSSDPLGRDAFQFARRLYALVGRKKEKGLLYRHQFRVLANAPVFAAKIAFALREEKAEDLLGPRLALKELDVASIYLERVVASFHILCQNERISQADAQAFFEMATVLKDRIRSRRNRLSLLLQFRGRPSS